MNIRGELVNRMAERGLIHQPSTWLSHGGALSAEAAAARLDRGDEVVLEHPTVGTVASDCRRVDAGASRDFDDFDPFEATRQGLLASAWRGNEIPIQGWDDLAQANAAERLVEVPGPSPLSPAMARASDLLRPYEGGQVQSIELERSDTGMDYWICSGDKSDKNPGLYDLQVKSGGFLGIGAHPERLTAFVAARLITAELRPVMIRTPDGRATVVRSLADLEALSRR